MNAKRKTQAEQRSERVCRIGPEPSVCLRQSHLRLILGSLSGAIERLHNNHYVSSMANRPSFSLGTNRDLLRSNPTEFSSSRSDGLTLAVCLWSLNIKCNHRRPRVLAGKRLASRLPARMRGRRVGANGSGANSTVCATIADALTLSRAI